jgi:hypothetical protein
VSCGFQLPATQVGTNFDVDKAQPSAPYDSVSGRWIVGMSEIAAEFGDLREVMREGSVGLFRRSSNGGDPIDNFDLVVGQDEFG